MTGSIRRGRLDQGSAIRCVNIDGHIRKTEFTRILSSITIEVCPDIVADGGTGGSEGGIAGQRSRQDGAAIKNDPCVVNHTTDRPWIVHRDLEGQTRCHQHIIAGGGKEGGGRVS